MVSGNPVLLGRQEECGLLDRLAGAARSGWSAVLVLRGEPGIGKTALLDHAAGLADGLRLVRVAGVESERELAFAAVQRLCAPMLDRLEELPGPQRDALATAFGLAAGNAPDRFLVGLALLGLLSDAGRKQPVLCVIDDAQWLDSSSAQALAFAARRLQADAVAVVLATRDHGDEFSGLPEHFVQGLSDADARALLDSVIGTRSVEERVRGQLIAETHGNPLALLELPAGFTPAALTGGFGIPELPGLPGRLGASFLRRYQALPADTQRLLLIAAADPTGDPVLFWDAARELGIGHEAAAAAEAAGLVSFGLRVIFRSHLVRSAVYGTAAPAERRAVHRALADVTDAEAQPARRAWHRAQAALGPDEDVAAELEREADRATACGGIAAAAAFLERATALTPDTGRRSARALTAAQARQQAGAFDTALAMLNVAQAGPLSALQHAEADLLRGRIAFATSYGSDAPPQLLKAAAQFAPLDPARARETYLEALIAALLAGRLATGAGLAEVAEATRAAPPPPCARPHDLLLVGLARLVTDGPAAAAALLREAVGAFRALDSSGGNDMRWDWLAGHAAGLAWDHESWDVISARFVRLGRETGTLTVLPVALNTRAGACLFAGDLAAAATLAGEEAAATQATGIRIAPYAALGLAAFQGREADAARLIEWGTTDVLGRGEGTGLTFIQWAAALLHNGLGQYAEALDWAVRASEDSDAQRFTGWALAELIEAAVRSGERDSGTDALRRLSQDTQATATDWGLGIEARARALLAEGENAERRYREAVERLGRTRLRPDLARSHLVYGEWLRRKRRRVDAREQLRRAYDLFAEIGMEAFAERARIELEATGERARRRTVETRADLTPQEAQVCRLAATGATNAEIAARLFISASTVDYHLRKAFRKLGVTSRRQLARHVL